MEDENEITIFTGERIMRIFKVNKVRVEKIRTNIYKYTLYFKKYEIGVLIDMIMIEYFIYNSDTFEFLDDFIYQEIINKIYEIFGNNVNKKYFVRKYLLKRQKRAIKEILKRKNY